MRQFGAIQCKRFIYLCSRQHVIKSCCPHILELEVEKMAMEKVEITGLFPRRLRQILESISLDFDQLEEVRLRCGQPVLLRVNGQGNGDHRK